MADTLRIPSPFELAEIVDDVLTDWAFLSARPAGKPAEGPVPFAYEFSVRHRGLPGLVAVLRCNQSFVSELARSTGPQLGGQALEELCARVGAALPKKMGVEGLGAVGVEIAPSNPKDWPLRKADSQCVIIADRFPIEFRLWAGAA